MADIIYNKDGDPMMIRGASYMAVTSSSTSNRTNSKEKTEDTNETFKVDDKEFVSWGGANNKPDSMNKIIGETGVLKTALSYKSRVCFGQGVVPVTVSGFDDKQNEIFEVVNDKDVIQFIQGYQFRKYLTSVFKDLFKFGNSFPVLIFNREYNKILRVDSFNARHCRISKDKTMLLNFGDFNTTQPSKDNSTIIPMLSEDDPFGHLEWMRSTSRLKEAVAFPRIKNFFCSNDFYGTADWESAMEAGWIDIANKVPKFIKRSYENAMTLKFHVKIPREYWEQQFPKKEYPDPEKRRAVINSFMDDFDKNLTGLEGVSKTLFTNYTGLKDGVDDKWIIEKLDGSLKNDEKLITSAAANSEILFSLMVNPSVLGAGMPGGPYSGNAGSGSDIRESFLVSALLSHIERQQVLDPIELMLQFNGVSDVQLKYKQLFLTTLDKGKSTESKIE